MDKFPQVAVPTWVTWSWEIKARVNISPQEAVLPLVSSIMGFVYLVPAGTILWVYPLEKSLGLGPIFVLTVIKGLSFAAKRFAINL